jgi:hypothetical protein
VLGVLALGMLVLVGFLTWAVLRFGIDAED